VGGPEPAVKNFPIRNAGNTKRKSQKAFTGMERRKGGVPGSSSSLTAAGARCKQKNRAQAEGGCKKKRKVGTRKPKLGVQKAPRERIKRKKGHPREIPSSLSPACRRRERPGGLGRKEGTKHCGEKGRGGGERKICNDLFPLRGRKKGKKKVKKPDREGEKEIKEKSHPFSLWSKSTKEEKKATKPSRERKVMRGKPRPSPGTPG